MAMTSSQFPKLTDEAVSVVVFSEFERARLYFPLLYDIQNSVSYHEKSATIGGLTEFQEYNGTGGINVLGGDQMTEQYSKEWLHKQYAKQVAISRDLIDDQRWMALSDIAAEVGAQAGVTMESHAVSLFNNMNSAGANEYKCDDGLSIANASHTSKSTGTTQSNLGTAALSATSLAASRLSMQGFKNYEDQILDSLPDTILVPLDLHDDGYELIKSAGKVDSAENNVNVHYGRYQMITWSRLTSTTAWFLIDSVRMKRALKFFIRIPLEVNFSSNNALSYVLSAYMRYSFGSRNWQWVYMNVPA